MRTIERSIEIAATPAQVWEVLADLDRYHEWNPFITEASGRAEPGARLRITITPPGSRPMRFSPRVLAAEVGERLVWLGRLGLPRLFDGRHELILVPAGPATTRLVHREVFRGLLVPFTGAVLARSAEGFDAMNRALAERVIARAAEAGPLSGARASRG